MGKYGQHSKKVNSETLKVGQMKCHKCSNDIIGDYTLIEHYDSKRGNEDDWCELICKKCTDINKPPLLDENLYRYGNSQVCINLVKILHDLDDVKMTRKVGRFLHQYFNTFKDISLMNVRSRNILRLLVLKDFKKKICESNYPKNVRTHVLNIIVTHYRKTL